MRELQRYPAAKYETCKWTALDQAPKTFKFRTIFFKTLDLTHRFLYTDIYVRDDHYPQT
jgi:hypothetical protein